MSKKPASGDPVQPSIPTIGLTVEEAAAALRTQAKTVRWLIQYRALPARMIGRRWIISPSALDAWLSAGLYETEKDGRSSEAEE